MGRAWAGLIVALSLVCACSRPDLEGLARGEEGVVAEAPGPTRLRLDSGLVVFLAEVDAPREEDAPRAVQAALAALTIGRPALLAYGERRRIPGREGEEAALAHVFVQGESGAWVWVQGEMTAAGFTRVRPRPGEAARADALLALEAQARDARRGLWAEAAHQPRSVELITLEAQTFDMGCGRGPFRLLEGVVDHVERTERAIYLNFGPPGAEQEDVTLRIRSEDWPDWAAAGVDPETLAGRPVRARGPAGFSGGPILCLEHPAALETLD